MTLLDALGDFSRVALSLVAIVNPLGAVPFFITLTRDKTAADQLRLARVAGQSVLLILVFAALIGEGVLDFFHVSLPAFRVGGGVLLMLMAIDMMHARQSGAVQTPEEIQEAKNYSEVAVVPLSIPLLSGPGAISAAILYSHEARVAAQGEVALRLGLLLGAAAVTALITWVSLRLAVPIGKRLGQSGINIVARLMGLLLAAIAVEFVTAGLLKMFPGLG